MREGRKAAEGRQRVPAGPASAAGHRPRGRGEGHLHAPATLTHTARGPSKKAQGGKYQWLSTAPGDFQELLVACAWGGLAHTSQPSPLSPDSAVSLTPLPLGKKGLLRVGGLLHGDCPPHTPGFDGSGLLQALRGSSSVAETQKTLFGGEWRPDSRLRAAVGITMNSCFTVLAGR